MCPAAPATAVVESVTAPNIDGGAGAAATAAGGGTNTAVCSERSVGARAARSLTVTELTRTVRRCSSVRRPEAVATTRKRTAPLRSSCVALGCAGTALSSGPCML